MCGGIFNVHLTVNLPRNLSVKTFLKSVKIWQNYGHESVAPFFWSTLVYRQRRQCVHKNVVNRGMVLDGLYNQHRGVSACIVRVQHEHLPKCVAFSHVTRANATFQSWWFHELSTAITKIIPLHQSNLSMQLTLSNNKPSLTDESTYFSKWLICWSFFSNSADAAVAELFNASACISAVQWLVCD